MSEFVGDHLHITCLDDLLRVTETSDIERLSDLIRAEESVDAWVAEIDGGIEVITGSGVASLFYPFGLGEFYACVDGVDGLQG
ncbi:hypothetical protein M6D93_03405 [Jatrophihabitans telluris]|uniref:Uncharacterized protein n=1 Tax=Jatrophihabitans telluris TaxID=2038343 RepID=A0ABY4R1R0_9ACTN|nr:hypothetical protein [Jatrophihabitans telluris]UQX89055.1 hypothetical protein M6D93_03405 [Jatrophihabitans telluris]